MSGQRELLVGRDLKGFSIERCNGIYLVDRSGQRVKHDAHLYIKDKILTQAFIAVKGTPICYHPADQEFFCIEEVLVLTDGSRAFLLDSLQEVQLSDEEMLRASIQEKAREKLGLVVCSLLGI
jgi:hypothetical protein